MHVVTKAEVGQDGAGGAAEDRDRGVVGGDPHGSGGPASTHAAAVFGLQ